jgi:hypothetical protein
MNKVKAVSLKFLLIENKLSFIYFKNKYLLYFISCQIKLDKTGRVLIKIRTFCLI